ncbi:hypothetical protein ABIF90_000167 [Bradyrhizobium japonicum]
MGKMPKFAKLQNTLLRRPNGGKRQIGTGVWAFFNSAFGLWLLSAIFLTVGGAIITARQECVVAGRSNFHTYRRLANEIYGRRLRLITAAEQSSNAIDYMKALRSSHFEYFREFDGQPLFSLIEQQERLLREIPFAVIYDGWIAARYLRLEPKAEIGTFFDVLRGGRRQLLPLMEPVIVNEDNLKAFKKYSPEVKLMFAVVAADPFGPSQVNCSPWVLLRRYLGPGDWTETHRDLISLIDRPPDSAAESTKLLLKTLKPK